MALELHVSGPGLELTRRLEPGGPALVLGRDAGCAICLPDPDRNVSRRHLIVWNEGDRLHFQVLSNVNGVDTAAGGLPPGASGVLEVGEMLGLAAFRVAVAPPGAAAAAAEASDPWAQLQQEAARLKAVPGREGRESVRGAAEDDPFGDWGFHSTFGPGTPSAGVHADGLARATDLQPFFAGLGLDPQAAQAFTGGELERMGRVTRMALQTLLQAAQAAQPAAATGQVTEGDDGTVADPREPNPLRVDGSLERKLYYLCGIQPPAPGSLPPERALRELMGDVARHDQVLREALHETLQAVLREFEPDTLKQRLLGGVRIFGAGRAWEAFARDYAAHMADLPAWAQQLLERHFAGAYARAWMRAKRNTTGRPDG